MEQTTNQSEAASITCLPGKDRAVRHFAVCLGMIAVSLYCWYEVFVMGRYPYVSLSVDLSDFLYWVTNTILPFFLLPVALVWLVLTIRYRMQVLVADGRGIGYRNKPAIEWGDIARIDATRLRKGFLDVYYGQDGQEKLVLDSWKLQNFRALVGFIEQHVPQEKIVR